jgi:hypothetical protein
VLVRASGGRARAPLHCLPARLLCSCACVRPACARVCTSARSLPAGPTYSRNPLRPLTPATRCGGATARPGDRPSPAPRRRDAASSSLRWPGPGPASPAQADHIGVARPGSGIGPGPAVALPGSGIAVWRLRLTTPAAAAAASAGRRRMASGPTGARRACASASSLHRLPARLLCSCAWPGSWALARASARARGARTSAGASEAGGDGNGRANMTKRHCVHESKRPLQSSGRHLRVARPGGGGSAELCGQVG